MDKRQLGELILDSQETMYRVAKTLLCQDEDCMDAMQEAIVKAFAGIESLRHDRMAKTWLIRILINECYTLLRKKQKLYFWRITQNRRRAGQTDRTRSCMKRWRDCRSPIESASRFILLSGGLQRKGDRRPAGRSGEHGKKPAGKSQGETAAGTGRRRGRK